MATKKSTTTKKSATKSATSKKSAAVKQTVTNPTGNETRVVCPKCGAEFDVLSLHEHQEQNVTVLGVDSGRGTILLPLKGQASREEALKAAGIDTSRYFSVQLPTGGTKMMRMNDEGIPVAVADDDPVLKVILEQGTIPNRNLFRRWVMSQMFHALQMRDGIAGWMACRGYDYQWKMMIEELRVQDKLYGRDMENFAARNLWFNKTVAIAMAQHYVSQVEKACEERPTHKCKGVPYIKFDYKDVFVSDIHKKILDPICEGISPIRKAANPHTLYEAVKSFWKDHHVCGSNGYDQCPEWKDAFKGAGAYFTMQNLLRFHGARFPRNSETYNARKTDLCMLEDAARLYKEEGWRLIGVMKQMIRECGIDIDKKMQEWSRAKSRHEAALKAARGL